MTHFSPISRQEQVTFDEMMMVDVHFVLERNT